MSIETAQTHACQELDQSSCCWFVRPTTMMIMFTTIGAKDVVLLSTLPALSYCEVEVGGTRAESRKEARGAKFARRSPPYLYLDRERAE